MDLGCISGVESETHTGPWRPRAPAASWREPSRGVIFKSSGMSFSQSSKWASEDPAYVIDAEGG